MMSEDRFKEFLFHALSHVENNKIELNPDIPYTASLSIGNSSPSVGRMQNDIAHSDDDVKNTYASTIRNSIGKFEGLDEKKADRII